MTQTYDISQSYQFNYERGPAFASPAPALPEAPLKDFLGRKVRSRIGIAAGLLLNSKWIVGYAERGYDILTYKTVRSAYRPCYDLPNWVFVDDSGPGDGPVYVIEKPPKDPSRISSAVCFGMPSMAPEVWREDVRRAKAGLRQGQMLIVSVVATPSEDSDASQVAADFCQCAEWAVKSGADAIEANFSCPNVCTSEGMIYMDPDLSGKIASAIRNRIGGVPLLIKVGHFKELEQMRGFLRAVDGVAQGVTMVNCIVRPVLNRDGTPAFGPSFVKAGVLGRAIHRASVQDVKLTAQIIREDKLSLAVAAVGGASTPGDFQDFFDAGADAVLMGSAPMYLPDLAMQAKELHPEW